MIETLPARLRRAVSPYAGIVRSVEECLAATADPAVFQAACEVGTERGLLGSSLDHLTGIGGAGRTRAEAASAAVGEAIERYSATFVPAERIVVASAQELPGAVAPGRFGLFSDRQLSLPGFPYRRFTDRTPVAWVEGWELPDGGPAWLPAELVYLGPVPVPPGRPIGSATSSGLSCREGRDEALLSGLLEVLERDAFMLTWANSLSLPLIDTSRSAQIEPEAHATFERTGLRFSAIDLSAFHALPVVLGVVRAPAGLPGAVGVGAAAAPTIERAWWKALSEAFAARSAGAKLALLATGDGASDDDVATFDDHIRRYARHEHASATEFLDASAARTAAASIAALEGAGPGEWIEALCRRVAAAGSTAYAVDVTSPDVASLGLTVTRVIAPELCRLDVAHSARFLGGRRLYEAAAALGLRKGILREDDVNPDPHPFP